MDGANPSRHTRRQGAMGHPPQQSPGMLGSMTFAAMSRIRRAMLAAAKSARTICSKALMRLLSSAGGRGPRGPHLLGQHRAPLVVPLPGLGKEVENGADLLELALLVPVRQFQRVVVDPCTSRSSWAWSADGGDHTKTGDLGDLESADFPSRPGEVPGYPDSSLLKSRFTGTGLGSPRHAQ
jgi:hypothetical protein